MDLPEADWKHLSAVRPLAIDRFCVRTLAMVSTLVARGDLGAPERCRELHDLVRRRDRDLARLFDDWRRSTAFLALLGWRAEGLLTPEEFAELTAVTRERVATVG